MPLLFPNNPFFHRGPVRDPKYFFGRTQEVRQSLRLLQAGQCLSIVGPRRIGKTSFLFHLCDLQVLREYGLGAEYLFVYVDCQGLEHLDKPPYYQGLWQEIRQALRERDVIENWPEVVGSFQELRDALRKVQNSYFKLVVLFDEFECLAKNQPVDQSSYTSLRSLQQDLGITYVTASQLSLSDLTRQVPMLGSAFFNNFHEISLSFLKPSEAENLVESLIHLSGFGSRFSADDLAFIFNIAGYHPFFLQLACYYLFEQKTDFNDLRAQNYEAVRLQYAEDAERFFFSMWRHLEPEERVAIQRVLEGQVRRIAESQRRRLEKKGILYNNQVFSSVFEAFLRRQIYPELVSENLSSVMNLVDSTVASCAMTPCRLDIVRSRYGSIGVRLSGSLVYESEHEGMVAGDWEAAWARRTLEACPSTNWRFHVKTIGQELFEDLILNRPQLAKAYQRAVSTTSSKKKELSLVLHGPRDLLRLPFEALYSEEEGYLCLKYPMHRMFTGCFFDKRFMLADLSESLHAGGQRPQALVVASNTWRRPEQRIPGVDREAEAVSRLLQSHGFEVCLLLTGQATESRVRAELGSGKYLLFHYAGHGTYDPTVPEKNALYFWEGGEGIGEVKALTALQLGLLIQNTLLQFVYLSSCWGAQTSSSLSLLDHEFLGIMDGLAMVGIPAILGFRWPVSDQAASFLARSFYSAWLNGSGGVDRALRTARQVVVDQMGLDERAWFSPVLILCP